MATENITEDGTTKINVQPGEHLLEVWGTFDSASLSIQHRGSGIPFSGLSAVTADLTEGKVIATGTGSVDVVTTSAGVSADINVRISKI